MRKRPREYLTESEIERLMTAAKDNRHGHRDVTAILVAYRHALRASELVSLRWDDVDFTTSRLHVRRAKGGETAVHPSAERNCERYAAYSVRARVAPISSFPSGALR